MQNNEFMRMDFMIVFPLLKKVRTLKSFLGH